jgi:hypothetical protein
LLFIWSLRVGGLRCASKVTTIPHQLTQLHRVRSCNEAVQFRNPVACTRDGSDRCRTAHGRRSRDLRWFACDSRRLRVELSPNERSLSGMLVFRRLGVRRADSDTSSWLASLGRLPPTRHREGHRFPNSPDSTQEAQPIAPAVPGNRCPQVRIAVAEVDVAGQPLRSSALPKSPTRLTVLP